MKLTDPPHWPPPCCTGCQAYTSTAGTLRSRFGTEFTSVAVPTEATADLHHVEVAAPGVPVP